MALLFSGADSAGTSKSPAARAVHVEPVSRTPCSPGLHASRRSTAAESSRDDHRHPRNHARYCRRPQSHSRGFPSLRRPVAHSAPFPSCQLAPTDGSGRGTDSPMHRYCRLRRHAWHPSARPLSEHASRVSRCTDTHCQSPPRVARAQATRKPDGSALLRLATASCRSDVDLEVSMNADRTRYPHDRPARAHLLSPPPANCRTCPDAQSGNRYRNQAGGTSPGDALHTMSGRRAKRRGREAPAGASDGCEPPPQSPGCQARVRECRDMWFPPRAIPAF